MGPRAENTLGLCGKGSDDGTRAEPETVNREPIAEEQASNPACRTRWKVAFSASGYRFSAIAIG